MTVDYNPSDKWLKTVMKANEKKLSDNIRERLIIDFYLDYYKLRARDNEFLKDKDIAFYLPFWNTMDDDIDCFQEAAKQNNLRYYYILFEDNPNEIKQQFYNDYGLCDRMNQFGYYQKAYQDEISVRLYHFSIYGGMCLFIEKITNKIFLFKMGEDDGSIFPDICGYVDYEIKGINHDELWALTSMVNKINAQGFNNQIVIDNLYKIYNKKL